MRVKFDEEYEEEFIDFLINNEIHHIVGERHLHKNKRRGLSGSTIDAKIGYYEPKERVAMWWGRPPSELKLFGGVYKYPDDKELILDECGLGGLNKIKENYVI